MAKEEKREAWAVDALKAVRDQRMLLAESCLEAVDTAYNAALDAYTEAVRVPATYEKAVASLLVATEAKRVAAIACAAVDGMKENPAAIAGTKAARDERETAAEIRRVAKSINNLHAGARERYKKTKTKTEKEC